MNILVIYLHTYNCSSSVFRGILTMRQYWWVFLTSPIHGLGTRLQSKMYKALCMMDGVESEVETCRRLKLESY